MTAEEKAWRAQYRAERRRIIRQYEHDHPDNPVISDALIESGMLAWLKAGHPPPAADLRKVAHDICRAEKQSTAFHPTVEQGKGFRRGRRLPTSDDAGISTTLAGAKHVQAYSDLTDLEEDAEDAWRVERRKWKRTRLAAFRANPHLKTLPEIEQLFGYEGPLIDDEYKPMTEVPLLPDDDEPAA
jgi:hypothetical protein